MINDVRDGLHADSGAESNKEVRNIFADSDSHNWNKHQTVKEMSTKNYSVNVDCFTFRKVRRKETDFLAFNIEMEKDPVGHDPNLREKCKGLYGSA